MAKTVKRERVRAARRAATAAAPCAAIEDQLVRLSDERWQQLGELLQGLLFIYCDETFTDLDRLCPTQLQLVVRLSDVRTESPGVYERGVDRVLNAVAALCVHADSLKGNPDLHADFWTRLLDSDMVMGPPSQTHTDRPVLAHKIIKYTRHYGIHVQLKWSSRTLQPGLFSCIKRFFNSTRIQTASTRSAPTPLRVSLSFQSCQLRTRDIRLLMDCLEIVHPQNNPAAMVCVTDSIEELDISDNPLNTEALHALASLFEANTRRVDTLNLSATLSSNHASSAFRRLMLAAFASQRPHHQGHGLALHLAHNRSIQSTDVTALRHALAQATRPLAGLSIAHITTDDQDTWLGFGHIFFSQDARAKTGDCWVDLTDINSYADDSQSIRLSLSNAIAATIPRIRQAIVDGLPVFCRLMDTVDTESTAPSLVPALDTFTPAKLYRVLNAWQNEEHGGRGFFQVDITSSTDKEPVLVQVEPSEIGSVVIDGHVIVGSRFTSLKYHDSSDRAHPRAKLFKAIGPDLTHLSLMGYNASYSHGIETILRCCPRVSDLNLSQVKLRVHDRLSVVLSHEQVSRLQVLRLDGIRRLRNGLENLQSCLSTSPNAVALRLLSASIYSIKAADLVAVRAMLRDDPSLECVEINAESGHDNVEYVAIRAAIQADLYQERRRAKAKLAFLSVVRGHQIYHTDHAVASQIFAFVGMQRQRFVLWKKYEL